MRAAELAGADPAETVRQAVASRDLAGARDIPAVIDARMRRSVNTMTPQPVGRWADRLPEVTDPEIREYLVQLAMTIPESVTDGSSEPARSAPTGNCSATAMNGRPSGPSRSQITRTSGPYGMRPGGHWDQRTKRTCGSGRTVRYG
jgi:hypothetical protein